MQTDVATEVVATEKQQTMATMEATTVDDATPITTTPTGSRSIRTTRLRVTKVLKRLRRRTPTNAEAKQAPLDRLDEEQLENRSEVSGITDIGDDLSCYGGYNLTHRIQSQRISRSFESSYPSKTLNSTDPSLSESLEIWCE